jgi:hypothetical protein|tara:strand:- start:1009 stop:1590 length:582 start_codon:yes stop_codon:yes gene_type:complete
MEVTFDLHKYITVFNDVMPKKTLESFKKICKNSDKFVGATIIGDDKPLLDEDIRKVGTWALHNINTTSYTEVLWCNYLIKHLKTCINNYNYFHDLPTEFLINDIQVLKYGKGGHYKFHTDHNTRIPRHYSCIFMINDDYEGGDLCFKYPKSEKITTIEKKENRMIIWPSNSLYPHCVLPVTKGERYSVVAWAL